MIVEMAGVVSMPGRAGGTVTGTKDSVSKDCLNDSDVEVTGGKSTIVEMAGVVEIAGFAGAGAGAGAGEIGCAVFGI